MPEEKLTHVRIMLAVRRTHENVAPLYEVRRALDRGVLQEDLEAHGVETFQTLADHVFGSGLLRSASTYADILIEHYGDRDEAREGLLRDLDPDEIIPVVQAERVVCAKGFVEGVAAAFSIGVQEAWDLLHAELAAEEPPAYTLTARIEDEERRLCKLTWYLEGAEVAESSVPVAQRQALLGPQLDDCVHARLLPPREPVTTSGWYPTEEPDLFTFVAWVDGMARSVVTTDSPILYTELSRASADAHEEIRAVLEHEKIMREMREQDESTAVAKKRPT